jgi:hypothetical protein
MEVTIAALKACREMNEAIWHELLGHCLRAGLKAEIVTIPADELRQLVEDWHQLSCLAGSFLERLDREYWSHIEREVSEAHGRDVRG